MNSEFIQLVVLWWFLWGQTSNGSIKKNKQICNKCGCGAQKHSIWNLNCHPATCVCLVFAAVEKMVLIRMLVLTSVCFLCMFHSL